MQGANDYPAPEWAVDQWFNSAEPLSVAGLKGRVIVLGVFQMLCPGCVAHGLPQLQKVAGLFDKTDVAVVGLHTVFEHHEAMTPVSLAAFLHEYRIDFPVGVDSEGMHGNLIPKSMAAYEMRGTPTTILIDRTGLVRRRYFGQVGDLRLGAEIATLIPGCDQAKKSIPEPNTILTGCAQSACIV